MIELGIRGGVVKIDEEDFWRVTDFNWYVHPQGYAARQERRAEMGRRSKRRTVYLHRFVLGATRRERRVVDHVNRDRLDCRKANLRFLGRGLNGWANAQARDAVPGSIAEALFQAEASSQGGPA